jgi:iron complex transport system ATP-binding protein
VLLARVLAGEPEWLLADEPLASLDPAHQLDVLDRLREVAASGGGVVLVLHDLHLAARVADDVVMMRRGRMIASGTADEVLVAPLIRETYGINAEVGRTADGTRFILPLTRAD